MRGASDKSAYVIDYRRNDALGIEHLRVCQDLGQPLGGIERVVDVLRFGDPVSKQQQNLAGFDPVVIDRIAELVDRAERGTTFGAELPQSGTAAENEG